MTPSVMAVHGDRDHRLGKIFENLVTLQRGLGVVGDAHAGVTVPHRSRVASDPTQPNFRQAPGDLDQSLVRMAGIMAVGLTGGDGACTGVRARTNRKSPNRQAGGPLGNPSRRTNTAGLRGCGRADRRPLVGWRPKRPRRGWCGLAAPAQRQHQPGRRIDRETARSRQAYGGSGSAAAKTILSGYRDGRGAPRTVLLGGLAPSRDARRSPAARRGTRGRGSFSWAYDSGRRHR